MLGDPPPACARLNGRPTAARTRKGTEAVTLSEARLGPYVSTAEKTSCKCGSDLRHDLLFHRPESLFPL